MYKAFARTEQTARRIKDLPLPFAQPNWIKLQSVEISDLLGQNHLALLKTYYHSSVA